MTKLSDYVFQFVADLGVEHVFMLPGGGCMHLVDSLGRSDRLAHTCFLHEQGAAIAAEAYGQYTNLPGVALVTTGPGGTNVLTAVAAAWLDSTPMLIITGQVKRADITGERGVRQMGFQEIDVVRMAKPVTKHAVTVMDPARIRYELEKCAHLAMTGRPGPTWIDIPLDIQSATIDPAALAGFEGFGQPLQESRAQPASVQRMIELLNEAERPAVLVGNGVRLANAIPELHEALALMNVPVLATWKAIDMVDDAFSNYAGRPGSIGQRGANFTQQNSDFLLCLGARLDLGQVGYEHKNFARAAKKVIVDIDPAELRKLDMAIDIAIAADAGSFLRELLQQRAKIKPRDRSPWLQRVASWQKEYPIVMPEYWQEPSGVNHYALLDALSDGCTSEDVFVPGSSGACSEATMQTLRVKRGMRVFNSEGLGPMGFGISAAIGGCIASGGKRTLCVDGDGGFVMNIQELETLRRLGLPVKIFVLDNKGYASIRSTQNRYFDGNLVASDAESGLTLPSVARVANAFGLRTLKIEQTAQLRAGVAEALAGNDPVVVEVSVPMTQETRPRLMSRQKADGSFQSTPLEDLYPFLDREEFRRNMLIAILDESQD